MQSLIVVHSQPETRERERGIFERADWDEGARTLTLSVRSDSAEATMALHWLTAPEWLALLDRAGFEVTDLWGWFNHRPYTDGEDMIFGCALR